MLNKDLPSPLWVLLLAFHLSHCHVFCSAILAISATSVSSAQALPQSGQGPISWIAGLHKWRWWCRICAGVVSGSGAGSRREASPEISRQRYRISLVHTWMVILACSNFNQCYLKIVHQNKCLP
ncbi:hypothetical protein C8R42DRAFT_413847 [Lentinula raphanica]|nr:hypothetical protein C8R42DRAFT_413847 [Lentinula raphanica]